MGASASGPPGEFVGKSWFDIYKPGKGTETHRSTDSSDPDLKDSIWWLDLLLSHVAPTGGLGRRRSRIPADPTHDETVHPVDAGSGTDPRIAVRG